MNIKEKILILDINIKKALTVLADICCEQSMTSFNARSANEKLIELKETREQLMQLLRANHK